MSGSVPGSCLGAMRCEEWHVTMTCVPPPLFLTQATKTPDTSSNSPPIQLPTTIFLVQLTIQLLKNHQAYLNPQSHTTALSPSTLHLHILPIS